MIRVRAEVEKSLRSAVEPLNNPHGFFPWQAKLTRFFDRLQTYSNKSWYHPLLFTLTAVDHFIGAVPVDTMLVSCTLLTPRIWALYWIEYTIGSTLGAAIMAALTLEYGQPWAHAHFADWMQGKVWIQLSEVIANHGVLGMFVISLLPVPLAPAIILCGLAKLPLIQITLSILIGRTIKYGLIAWVTSHAPRLLFKNSKWTFRK